MVFVCPNNSNVDCGKKECHRCGWNPEVAKARLEAFIKGGNLDERKEDSDTGDS